MKILVTGGAGFIGSNLCKALIGKDYEVFALDNLITGSEKNIEDLLPNQKFHFIKQDVAEFEFKDIGQVNLIFHLASPASPKKYLEYPLETLMANSLGIKHVLDFANETKTKAIVFASTSEVYGDPQVHPQTEDYFGHVNPVGPRSCYDEGKRFAESLCMTYVRLFNMDIRIARIFNTYGPNMEKEDGRVVSNFISQALSGKPITVFGEGNQTRSFCFVSDMVSGLFLLSTIKNLKGEIVNLGNPDERKIIDMAHLIKRLIGSTSEITFSPVPTDDPKKRKPAVEKAQNLLGWKPQVILTEGLQKTIDYFKKRFFS